MSLRAPEIPSPSNWIHKFLAVWSVLPINQVSVSSVYLTVCRRLYFICLMYKHSCFKISIMFIAAKIFFVVVRIVNQNFSVVRSLEYQFEREDAAVNYNLLSLVKHQLNNPTAWRLKSNQGLFTLSASRRQSMMVVGAEQARNRFEQAQIWRVSSKLVESRVN